MTNTQNPRTLSELHAAQAALNLDIFEAVSQARAEGSSWANIGAALGMSKQAAQQKFGRFVELDSRPEPAEQIPGQLEALPAAEPQTEFKPKDYRDEAEMLRFSKATQRFVGQAEKRGLSYEVTISKPLSDEPAHQVTITVEDPSDPFHYVYWIQTASVFNWSSSKNPSHSLTYSTGPGRQQHVPQNRAGSIMDGFKK